MPWKTTKDRARKDLEAGKAPTTAAGEFVREEMEHVKRGKHGVRSSKQAIAIGLSKARKAGLPIPARGRAAGERRRPAASAARGTKATKAAGPRSKKTSAARSRAASKGGRAATRGGRRTGRKSR